MNLGTTCIFDFHEMCCPRILYIAHFEEQLTITQAQEKMSKITGYDLQGNSYYSACLEYVDNTRLYHLCQLGEETEEVNKAKDILNRYRPQILKRTINGMLSNPLLLKFYAIDAEEYMYQQRFYYKIKELLNSEYAELLAKSKERRASKVRKLER